MEKNISGLRETMEELQLTRAAIERTRDAMYWFNADAEITDVNETSCEVLGYSREELLSMSMFDVDVDLSEENFPQILETLKQQRSMRFESRHRTRDGEVFPVEDSFYYMEFEGEPYYFSFANDITERREAEKALRESEARARALLDAIPDMMFRLSEDGVFLDFKADRARDLAVPPEAFLGQEIGDVLPPEVAQITMKNVRRVLETGGPVAYEYRLSVMEGEVGEYEARMVASGPDEVVAIVRDITERKKAEKALRESEMLFRSVVENSPTGIFIVGEDYRFSYANDELSRILGYSPEEIIGLDFRQVLDEESRQVVADRYVRRQRGEEVPPRYELAVVRKDGEKRQLEMSAVVIEDSMGRLQTVAQVLDVTERKQAQRRLRESLERRARQVELVTEIAQEIVEAPALEELYERVITLVKERLGYYHTQVFRYDPQQEVMRVVKGYGEVGKKMQQAGHNLPYGEGVVGTAAATGEPVLASDVTDDPNWMPHPDLPDTKGELAVPIKWQDDVLGVLDVQSDEPGALTEEDQVMLMGLAGQVANAIQSTNLLVEVQESQQFLDTILDNIPNPIFYQDAQGVYIGCNDAFLKYLGEPGGDVRGKTVYDITPDPELADMYHQMDMEMIQNPGTEAYEASVEYADGSIRDVVFYKTTFNDPDGGVGGLIGTFMDITERKQAELLLNKRVEELNCLTDVGQRIAEEPPVSELFRWIAERIPPAMQYPDLCRVAVEFGGEVYGDPAARDYACQVVAGLRVGDQRLGQLYVAYTEERDFLDEESALLGGIVRRVENYIERRRATQQLEERARREQILREITAQVRNFTDPDAIARTAVQELGAALNRPTFLRLGSAEELSRPPTDGGNGDDDGLNLEDGGE